MNITTKLILGVLGIVLLFFLYLALPWMGMYSHLKKSPDPPQPEITYGEFPFKLVYEINGVQKVIEDVLVCEYDGIGMNEGQGKFLKWKQHLKSNSDEEGLLLLAIIGTKEIYYSVGSADYYMGEKNRPKKIYNIDEDGKMVYMGIQEVNHDDYHLFPSAIYDDSASFGGVLSEAELLNEYNIKMISWDYTKPIENKFVADK